MKASSVQLSQSAADIINSLPQRILKHRKLQHPLTLESLPNFNEGTYLRRTKECIAVRVSKKNIDRSLRIFDCILLTLTNLQIPVRLKKWKDRYSTIAEIDGEEISFWIEERSHKVDVSAQRTGPYFFLQPTHQLKYNGKLILMLDKYGLKCRGQWGESPRRPLESLLSSFVYGLFEAAIARKDLKAAREETYHLREEMERPPRLERERRAREEARKIDFLSRAKDWELYQTKLSIIRDIEFQLKSAQLSPEEAGALQRWVGWAKCLVEAENPIRSLASDLVNSKLLLD